MVPHASDVKHASPDLVPTVCGTCLLGDDRRGHALCDNHFAEDWLWDEALLTEELAAIELDDIDLATISFDQAELSNLFGDDPGDGDGVRRWVGRRCFFLSGGSTLIGCGKKGDGPAAVPKPAEPVAT